MSSPGELAGWTCHVLGPHFPALLSSGGLADESPSSSKIAVPPTATKLWQLLAFNEFGTSRGTIISAATQLLQKSDDTAVMQRHLFTEIRQVLISSRALCAELEALQASFTNVQPNH